MDNPGIARILREIADLLEIKNENPFKIRAYRNAGDTVSNHPHAMAALDVAGLREIPGIGKDLAVKIREIVETGSSEFHRGLLAEFPPSVLDILHLQGIGPKTVAVLYRELGIRTLDDLERAAMEGRIRAIKGMGEKKETLIRKALEERKSRVGRHLLSKTCETAERLVAYLRDAFPAATDLTLTPVGSLRRGCETCGDVDILASFNTGSSGTTATTVAAGQLMDRFVSYGDVERVLAKGETKSSILVSGFQADLRVVPADSRGAALQYFTGSKAHNIALRDRAIRLGLKLNEYGVFRIADDVKIAGDSEEGVYEALGLQWTPPELREARGEVEAAEHRALPRVIERSDLRGDLHMHTTETDGKDDLAGMIMAARDAGLEYIAITDHSQSLAMANGLDEQRALRHAERIRALDGQYGVRVLAGIECDILTDGELDLDDDCLAALDIVVASVHSGFNQDRQQITDRLLRVIENPHVDILGHPTGRALLRREPLPVDMSAILTAAKRHGVALEINCQPHRLDLNDAHARLAKERGVPIVISTDAHSRAGLEMIRWGVAVARRAWLEPADVLNTRPFEHFRTALRRNAARA